MDHTPHDTGPAEATGTGKLDDGDHEQIIQALRGRDQARAREEMEAHILGTVGLIHAEARAASAGMWAEGSAQSG